MSNPKVKLILPSNIKVKTMLVLTLVQRVSYESIDTWCYLFVPEGVTEPGVLVYVTTIVLL